MSLFLFPALSPLAKRSSWWTAYGTTFEQVLKHLQPASENEIARLDVAVVLPSSYPSTASRTAFYALFQDILREVYSLIVFSATQAKVELDFPGGVDTRVFFVDPRLSDTSSTQAAEHYYYSGPIIDFQTLVAARRPYQSVFSIESESGEAALQSLLHLWREKGISPTIQRLPCGPSITSPDQTNTEGSNHNSHRSVAVGGTFDHLHIGHKLLLAATVYMPQPGSTGSTSSRRQITIGITGDELLVNKKHGSLVESWDERQQRTAEFVDSILVFHPSISAVRTVQDIDQPGPNGRIVRVIYDNQLKIDYTRISDPFGPTITDEAISALIISAETRAGGKAVNDKRIEKGWKALEVFEVDVLDAKVDEDYKGTASEGQTFETKISSTEIRKRLEAKARSSNGHL